MNLEEEVFKIGKQLEKIVGEEGTVSLTFNCWYFHRPVGPLCMYTDKKMAFINAKKSIPSGEKCSSVLKVSSSLQQSYVKSPTIV